MFCFEYPFQSLNTDTVLYLIGSGLKNISANIQIPKEFKVYFTYHVFLLFSHVL